MISGERREGFVVYQLENWEMNEIEGKGVE